MPSRVLETVLTGRNLLSPVLTGAAADVEAYDGKVTAANQRAATSADTSAKAQTTAADRVVAANTRSAASATESSAKVTAANTRAAESTRAYAEATESSAARSAVAWTNLATKGVPLAAAAIAVVTGKMAGDFQSDIVRLETTAGELPKNLSMVSKGLLDMAGDVGVGADTLAKGLYVVESAGYHGADALKVERAAAQGAAQEHADLAKVTDAVTTALHDYNLPASQAAKVTSEMVTAVSHGKTTFDELTGSLHSITPLASALHIPLSDILGDVAAMTASGESADQSTQNLADALRHLQNPTSIMTNELAQLGITSSDLSDELSSKGLSGTIQEISQAILTRMGPSGKVLLDALNQSKIAQADLNQMMAAMPPELARSSQALLDGKGSIKDYQMAAKDMGGDQGAMALQFLSLYKNADGFNQALKSGSPAAQAYSAALQKAMGDASGLTVALQLTGDHTAAVNSSIKDIAKSSGDASGNIKGWDEVQGTFNQKLREAGAAAGALAIQTGQHVLPALSGVVGWIGSTGIPGIEHFASGVGDAVHWFMQLPGPVKEAVLTLAALKAVTSTDMFAGLLASGRVVAVGFANDMSNMVASARAGAGSITAAFAEAKAAQQALVAEQFGASAVSNATGDIRGLGAAAGAAAKGGLSAMKSAAGGVVSMLGGPWVLATAGAVVGVVALMDAIKRHDEEIQKATTDVQKWDQAIALGAGGQTAMQAQQNLDDLRGKLAAVTAQIDRYNAAAHEGAARGGIGTLVTQQQELRGELDKGSKAWDAQLASMTPVEIAQGRVQQSTRDLNMALKDNPPNSDAVVNASRRLSDAQSALTYQTNLANDASETQLQRLQDLANKQLGAVNSGLAAQQSQLQFLDAVSQLNAGMADGSVKGNALAEAQNGLAQSAISAAQAAGQNAADQAKASGATDTAQASNAAMLKSLQDNEQYLTGPAKAAIDAQIQILQGATVQTDSLTDAIGKMGLTTVTESDRFRAEWGNNVQVLSGATAQQIKDLQGLGLTVMQLPNHQIVVSADTGAARNALTQLSNDYGQYSINLGVKIGSGTLARAAGGPIVGAGTATSDSIPVMASNGEHMWTAAEVQAAGGHGAMHALRSAVLGGALHRASGGPVTFNDLFLNAKVGISPSSMSAAEAAIKQMFTFTSAGGNAGNRALGQQIAAAMGLGGQFSAIDYVFSHESGWNNLAQNPTSTAYGIAQFLDSTWASVGGHKTSDPGLQIQYGLKYMNKYGGPNGAAAFWAAHHWYGDGGVVSSPQLAVVGEAGPEAIVPLSKPGRRDAVMAQAGLSSPASMPGYGRPADGRTSVTVTPQVTVQARVFVGSREITDIVRVEATAIVDRELGSMADTIHYAGG